MTDSHTPDLMPVLSRGKHRNPRKGACFMELASYLAGEPWSDHPSCTHPLLAALARDVNDHVGDDARRRLAPMIPEVIGLHGDDPRVDVLIARNVARTALPVVAAERQGVAAVGILRCERVLNELEGRPLRQVSDESAALLEEYSHAARWARSFSHVGFGDPRSFRRRSAPTILHSGVLGVASACVDDPDALLVGMLADTIEKTRGWLADPHRPVLAEARWHEVVALTNR